MYALRRAFAVGRGTGDMLMLVSDGSAEVNRRNRLRTHTQRCDLRHLHRRVVRERGWCSIESVSDGDYFRESFSRPLRAISLHPRYNSQNDKPFVCGGTDDKLRCCSHGCFLGESKSTTIDENDNGVFCVRWHGNCMAWATSNRIVLPTRGRRRCSECRPSAWMRPSAVLLPPRQAQRSCRVVIVIPALPRDS
jgi:hypothetical protein